jgi:hypothetical protein
MARKKSKRDSRGYSTHVKTIHMPSRDASSIAGTSKQKVKVSKAAQDELSCLLDKLRNDLQLGGGNQRGKKEPIFFSTKDKKMVNKIIKLVCICMGFCLIDYLILHLINPRKFTHCSLPFACLSHSS